jgi:hypothetical protein
MREIFRDNQAYSRSLYIGGPPQKRYGFFSFMFDIVMTFVTGGFWLIWIFAREMRRR